MITTNYKPLFNVEIPHSFYHSGKCTDLLMIPTPESQTTIQRLGLRYLPTDFGGSLFAKVNTVGVNDIIKNPLPENTRFCFLLIQKNPRFGNFSNISLNRPAGSHYYFNNLGNNMSADHFPLLVTDGTAHLVSDTDLMPFVSGTLSFVQNNTGATQEGEIRFTDTGEVFPQTLNNFKNQFNFSFDLNQTPGGRVKLFVEGAEKASAYVIAQENVKDLFGIVEIFYKSGLAANYQFQNSDQSIVTRFYKIPFANRSTRWRYVISKKFDQSVTGVTVGKANGPAIAFTVQPGSPANQFVLASNDPLPLEEDPVLGIKLSDQANRVIIENLPNPPLNIVRPEGPNVFSDILITI